MDTSKISYFKKEIVKVIKRLASDECVNAPVITNVETDARQLSCGKWFFSYVHCTITDTYTFVGRKTVNVYRCEFDGTNLRMDEVNQ